MNRLLLPCVLAALVTLPLLGCESKKRSPAGGPLPGETEQGAISSTADGQLASSDTSSSSDDASEEEQATVEPTVVESGNDAWIKAEQLPWEAHFLQFVDGRRIGYTQLKVDPPTLPGSKQLMIQRLDSVEFLRAEKPVRVIVQLDALELSDGRLLEFTEKTINGTQETLTTGKLTRGFLKLTTKFADTIKSESIKVDYGAWGMLGLQAVLMKESLEPGNVFQAKYYAPSMRTIVDATVTVLEPEETAMADGTRIKLVPVDVIQMVSEDNGVRSRNWVDSEGQIQKTVTFSGLNISWFRTTGDVIERIRDGYRLRDDVLAMYAPVSGDAKLLDDPSLVTYMVEASGVDPFVVLPTEGRQKVQSATARRAALLVSGVGPEKLPASDVPADMQPYLNESATIDTRAAAVQDLAKQFGAPETADLFARVAAMANGLHANFTHEEQLQPELRSTFELTSKKSVDVLEASRLLAAMLRSQEIPARCVGGLLLDRSNMRLNYHAWVEAWVDKKWVGLDPTIGGFAGVDHVKVLDSALGNANPFEIVLPVLDLLPQLQFTLSDLGDSLEVQ